MKNPLKWMKVRLNIWDNPFNILYWALLLMLLYFLAGIYGMNWS